MAPKEKRNSVTFRRPEVTVRVPPPNAVNIRRSSFKKKRAQNFQLRYQRPPWYKIRFKNPDPRKDVCGIFYMFAQMHIIWLNYIIATNVTKRRIVKILSVTTAFNLILGIISLVIGLAFVGVHNPFNPNPYIPIARTHYMGLSIMGGLLNLSSIFGFVGIYGKNLKCTKAFALISFVYGYLLENVYISWLMQIHFDTHIVKINSSTPVTKRNKDSPAAEHVSGKARVHRFNTRTYNLTFYFMNIILLAAILQLLSGILTLWLLVMHTKKQGYVPMYRRTSEQHHYRMRFLSVKT